MALESDTKKTTPNTEEAINTPQEIFATQEDLTDIWTPLAPCF